MNIHRRVTMVSEQTGSSEGSPFKKWFMRQYWRVQQSQTIISMAFWVTTLTLLIWPYVRWRFENDSTIAGTAMIISWKKPGTEWGVLVQKMMITLPRQRFRAAYSSNTSLIRIHEELRKSPRMCIFGREVWPWNRPHDIHNREADSRKIWFGETI